jgi:hypothetical protein
MTLQEFYQGVNNGKIDAVVDSKSSVTFNGRTVTMNPTKANQSNGFPSMDPLSYLRKNHPDLVSEFQNASREKNREHARIDNHLTGGIIPS